MPRRSKKSVSTPREQVFSPGILRVHFATRRLHAFTGKINACSIDDGNNVYQEGGASTGCGWEGLCGAGTVVVVDCTEVLPTIEGTPCVLMFFSSMNSIS